MHFLTASRIASRLGFTHEFTPSEAVYWAMLSDGQQGSHRDRTGVYIIDPAQDQLLEQAAEMLHVCFLKAVDYVLADQARLAPFCIPESLLSPVRESWKTAADLGMTGRFDFSVHGHGIKLYEYNTDSPSCIFETAHLQGAMIADMAIPGVSAGQHLSRHLIDAWQAMGPSALVHILRDNTAEEWYHSLFMKELIEASGKRCKILVGASGVCVGEDGFLVDGEGERLELVWKTWSWSSIFEAVQSRSSGTFRERQKAELPALADILLHSTLRVVEPLWKWIPSCKAILPVLWELFPDNPFLLPCFYSPDSHLWARGYAAKPINGRCGLNVELHSPRSGRLSHEMSPSLSPSGPPRVYQELSCLPWIDHAYVQVHAFTVRGHYAGAGLRLADTPVIPLESQFAPLCIADSSLS